MITRIQDEAHRFAIEYHRSLRSKEQVHSVLDDIPGIGPARRKALMRRFQSLDAIRSASIEELSGTEAMNEKQRKKYSAFSTGERKRKEKENHYDQRRKIQNKSIKKKLMMHLT